MSPCLFTQCPPATSQASSKGPLADPVLAVTRAPWGRAGQGRQGRRSRGCSCVIASLGWPLSGPNLTGSPMGNVVGSRPTQSLQFHVLELPLVPAHVFATDFALHQILPTRINACEAIRHSVWFRAGGARQLPLAAIAAGQTVGGSGGSGGSDARLAACDALCAWPQSRRSTPYAPPALAKPGQVQVRDPVVHRQADFADLLLPDP